VVFERLLLTVDLSSEVSVVIVGAKGLPFCAEVVDLVGEVPHLSFDLVCLSIILAQEGFLCVVFGTPLFGCFGVTHPNKN